MGNIEMYTDLIIMALAVILLSIAQSYLAARKPWYTGLFFPGIYWVFAVPYIIGEYIGTSEIQLAPDYYSAASFFFPGIWLILLYYMVFYYQKWKVADESKN